MICTNKNCEYSDDDCFFLERMTEQNRPKKENDKCSYFNQKNNKEKKRMRRTNIESE
jgi:hypothetical protein